MLLSLVVIFTQSIQLSKIVERFALLRRLLGSEEPLRPLGSLEHSCSRFNLAAWAGKLNLRHVCNTSSPFENGGAERDRTVDPLLAKQVLSQLSYSPNVHQYN
jgi:hypothetical protein